MQYLTRKDAKQRTLARAHARQAKTTTQARICAAHHCPCCGRAYVLRIVGGMALYACPAPTHICIKGPVHG